ncbi:MAG TPA: hydroxyisourate hydrolase [Bacteroidota bacterium]|nr:hydroxyisourate hydrolase [Bacteroidota bacterium]
MKSPITTHVLDTMHGMPASGITTTLEYRTTPGTWKELSRSKTGSDGRIMNFLPENFTLDKGVYRLTFFTDEYFRMAGSESFFPFITITFEVKDIAAHYHIPLLLSPFGYSTYRGS